MDVFFQIVENKQDINSSRVSNPLKSFLRFAFVLLIDVFMIANKAFEMTQKKSNSIILEKERFYNLLRINKLHKCVNNTLFRILRWLWV